MANKRKLIEKTIGLFFNRNLVKKAMLLVIDVGNTNHVFAVFKGCNLVRSWRLSTHPLRTEDEYAVILEQFLKMESLSFCDVKNVVVSNVVPQTEYAIARLCETYLRCNPFIVGRDSVNIGITIDLENPKEVGSDRLVNALAAYKKYNKACIIVDFGTATNFDVINQQGVYKGGIIAPGIHLSLDALHKATAKLPRVKISKAERVIGNSTISAIQSGIYFGYISMIEGLIARIKKESDSDYYVIGTGGLASLIAKGTDIFKAIEPDLTIDGLKHIYDLNIKDVI